MKVVDSKKFKEDRNVRHGLVKEEKVKAKLINLKRKHLIAITLESGFDSLSPSKTSNELSSNNLKLSIEQTCHESCSWMKYTAQQAAP